MSSNKRITTFVGISIYIVPFHPESQLLITSPSNGFENILQPWIDVARMKGIDIVGGHSRNANNVSLYIDDISPQIVRMFVEYGRNIKMITDEKARCYYSLDDCNFDKKNGIEIGSFGFEHTIGDAVTVLDYYIKCEDEFKNTNPACAAVVSKASLSGK